MNISPTNLTACLAVYRQEIEGLRQKTDLILKLPEIDYYLFGMGARRKLIYRQGLLLDSLDGSVVRSWEVAAEFICPPEYCVILHTVTGQTVSIYEDEMGIWVQDGTELQSLSEGTLHLPRFEGHPYALVLRVLHQEILVNILDGSPLPNLFVYRKPWYRDGAMVAMVLSKTGNIDLIRDWVLGLMEPYDRNNAGIAEADNPGQLFYLISLVSDGTHPLVLKILEELPKFHKIDVQTGFLYIEGQTDFALRPAYQTQWLKWGLAALGLPDPYQVPPIEDTYSKLCWWSNCDRHTDGTKFPESDQRYYPYLEWAANHFHGQAHGPMTDRLYPLTWEARAGSANYDGMNLISPEYVCRKLAAPHTWHAAEMFLSLYE